MRKLPSVFLNFQHPLSFWCHKEASVVGQSTSDTKTSVFEGGLESRFLQQMNSYFLRAKGLTVCSGSLYRSLQMLTPSNLQQQMGKCIHAIHKVLLPKSLWVNQGFLGYLYIWTHMSWSWGAVWILPLTGCVTLVTSSLWGCLAIYETMWLACDFWAFAVLICCVSKTWSPHRGKLGNLQPGFETPLAYFVIWKGLFYFLSVSCHPNLHYQ